LTIYIHWTTDQEQAKHKSSIYTRGIYTRGNTLTKHTWKHFGLINWDYKNYKNGTRNRKH